MPDGSSVRVCKVMFLSSLGAKSDGFVMDFVRSKLASPENAIFPRKDGRGRRRKVKNEIHEQIIQHINSYNPAVSHYRRDHAPNRRYLDAHLTIKGLKIKIKFKKNLFNAF